MDSVNSGMSLQSSSGAEEECDSPAATTTTTTTNLYQPHQPPLPPFNHHIYNSSNQINNPNPNPTFFPPTPQHQLDSVIWSKTLLPSFSQVTTTHEPITPMPTLNPNPNKPHSVPTKNPKKRSRASRKAPTTVLTTDTSNFRAMVQEFTGIPAPPFASSSSSPLFPRLSTTSSFDLFGRPSFLSSSMAMRSSNHHHLFDNPFPQILFQSSSSSSTSSLLDNYSMQQNTVTFPSSNSQNQLSPFHDQDPKTIQNVGSSNHLFDHDDHVIGQTQILELPITTSNNVDQVASGNIWDGNRKESSGVKGDQGLFEPWICSSD